MIAQKSFINSFINYSSNGEESLATRGSAALGEFDNYFKSTIKPSNPDFSKNLTNFSSLTTIMRVTTEDKDAEIEDIEEIEFF